LESAASDLSLVVAAVEKQHRPVVCLGKFVVIRSTSSLGEGRKVGRKGRSGALIHMERRMTETVTITNEELAVLCDIVSGWSVKRSESLDADKRLVLDRLVANGFVVQANGHSLTKYQHTVKTELLFTQLCVGISGG
jgi:hypothetical protein